MTLGSAYRAEHLQQILPAISGTLLRHCPCSSWGTADVASHLINESSSFRWTLFTRRAFPSVIIQLPPPFDATANTDSVALCVFGPGALRALDIPPEGHQQIRLLWGNANRCKDGCSCPCQSLSSSSWCGISAGRLIAGCMGVQSNLTWADKLISELSAIRDELSMRCLGSLSLSGHWLSDFPKLSASLSRLSVSEMA
jgi:hypothetical protein